jgi:nucleoside-diphosphate-sugar epimerase
VEPVLVPDLLDRTALRRLVEGANAVVHLAGRAHVLREDAADPIAEFRRVNVEGTRVLLEEALVAGVSRFIFVSSVAAVGEVSGGSLDESSPPEPGTPYGISKLEAEAVVTSLADTGKLSAVILRPPMVYGPGMQGNPLRLLHLIDRGFPLPLGSITNRRSMLYIGNLVSAIRHVLDTTLSGVEIYFVADGESSTPQFVRSCAAAIGRPARLVSAPVALLRAVGKMGDVLARIAPIPITSDGVDRLLGSLVVNPTKLEATGFRSPVSAEEGIRLTGKWFRDAVQRTRYQNQES